MKSKKFNPLFGKFGGQSSSNSYVPPPLRSLQRGAKRLSHGCIGTVLEISAAGVITVFQGVDDIVNKMVMREPTFSEERWLGTDGKIYGRLVQIPKIEESVIQDIIAL